MHTPCFFGDLLEPFLFEFIAAAVITAIIASVVTAIITTIVTTVIAAVIIPLLEFLIAFVAIIAVSAPVVLPFPVFIRPETFDIRRIGKFQLSAREIGQFALDGIVMNGFLMPVVIGEFHVISYGIGESIALVWIFFGQRFVDHDLQVLTKVAELGVPLWILQRLGPGSQRLPCGNRIRGGYFQFEVGDQKKMIP